MIRKNMLQSFFFAILILFPFPSFSDGLDDTKKGLDALDRGEYDLSIDLFSRAINSGQLSSKHLIISYYNRGIAWGKKSDYDNAIFDLTKAIELNPKDAMAYKDRGIAFYQKSQYDQAISDYTKAIELIPKHAMAFINRGTALYQKSQYDQAISDYTKAIEINPKDATAYNSLSWLLATSPDDKRRDGERAIKMAEKAFEIKDEAYILNTMAAAFAEAGRFKEAIETQKRAIERLRRVGGKEKNIAEYQRHLASYIGGKPLREQ